MSSRSIKFFSSKEARRTRQNVLLKHDANTFNTANVYVINVDNNSLHTSVFSFLLYLSISQAMKSRWNKCSIALAEEREGI